MNVLLNGGTGFIGSYTAVELMAAGHRTMIADNLANSSSAVIERLERLMGPRRRWLTPYRTPARRQSISAPGAAATCSI